MEKYSGIAKISAMMPIGVKPVLANDEIDNLKSIDPRFKTIVEKLVGFSDNVQFRRVPGFIEIFVEAPYSRVKSYLKSDKGAIVGEMNWDGHGPVAMVSFALP